MHVHPTGMEGPGACRLLSGQLRLDGWMVLGDAHLPHGKAGGPQAAEQLVAVVLQGLEPGAGGGSHREHAALQAQGAAVGGQLGTGQGRPALPQGPQVALALPLLLQRVEALGQGRGRRVSGRHHHRDAADAALTHGRGGAAAPLSLRPCHAANQILPHSES